LCQAKTPYSMTRIQWHSKPKIVESDLFFAKWGRVSRITNQYLNQLLSHYTGFETDVLCTGNAGEHALSMPLALALDFSAGFSVETYQFVTLMEKFGGVIPGPYPEIMKNGVEVFQIESRNPHLHEATKGDPHIREMIEYSLSVLWHSPICPDVLKKKIMAEFRKHKIVGKDGTPIRLRKYPVLADMDFDTAGRAIDWSQFGNYTPA
ncbi:MAG TPA: mannosyl-3-phosphoglycerate synthase, partial [Saprospiraceae bacterium]|nr:mannosyl-3-phosphoglycerate synthase [Saprospiraceae bacterium]